MPGGPGFDQRSGVCAGFSLPPPSFLLLSVCARTTTIVIIMAGSLGFTTAAQGIAGGLVCALLFQKYAINDVKEQRRQFYNVLAKERAAKSQE